MAAILMQYVICGMEAIMVHGGSKRETINMLPNVLATSFLQSKMMALMRAITFSGNTFCAM
jgi:hypothetical protein